MPIHLTMPDLLIELWNCGDMVDSFSGIVRDNDQLELVFFNRLKVLGGYNKKGATKSVTPLVFGTTVLG